jgi:hypothetical protein
MFNRGSVFHVRTLIVSSLEDLGHKNFPAVKSVSSLIGLWSLWSLISANLLKFTAICVVLIVAGGFSPDDEGVHTSIYIGRCEGRDSGGVQRHHEVTQVYVALTQQNMKVRI